MTEFEAQQAVTDSLGRLVEALDRHPDILSSGVVTIPPDHFVTLGKSAGLHTFNYYIDCRWSDIRGRDRIDVILDDPKIRSARAALEIATRDYAIVSNKNISIDIGSYNLQGALSIAIGMNMVCESEVDTTKLFLLELAIACW